MTLKELFKNTLFFLGAGASKDADCMSSNEMLDDLKKEISELSNENANRVIYLEIYEFIIASLHYQYSLKSKIKLLSKNIITIEDFVFVLRQIIDKEFIIPYPLVGNWNEKITKWEISSNDRIFIEFLQFIEYLLINKWTVYEATKATTLLTPIKELLQSADEFTMNIFTLNYDLIFEKNFIKSNEILMQTGFAKGKWCGFFDNNQTKLNYYKLHGSLDWLYDNVTEEITNVKLKENNSPLIIFGTNNKMVSFDPFLDLLSELRNKLKEASLYIIIGYSFHDKYINNLLIQQLMSDITKKLIVVDPKYKDNQTKSETFAKELEDIQQTRSLLNKINFSRINPEKIQLIGISSLEFYNDYLINDAEKIKLIIEDISKDLHPFG